MELFLQNGVFFAISLLKFTLMFFTIWGPAFLLAALLILRFRQEAWAPLRANATGSGAGMLRGGVAGILGSVGLRASRRSAWELLGHGHSVATTFTCLIANRNLTIVFFSILTLSLGVEFAFGHVLGTLVMILVVRLGLRLLPITTPPLVINGGDAVPSNSQLETFDTWATLVLRPAGWLAMLRYIGGEIRVFALPLLGGIALAGMIFAGGMESWWPLFAAIIGPQTMASDLVNALVAPFLSASMFLAPVGNLPVIHALFKTDGLAYPGIISLCLASVLHPGDVLAYCRTFGRRQGIFLAVLLYLGAVLGGLGSTWIYAVAGFRPQQPPLEVFKVLMDFITG